MSLLSVVIPSDTGGPDTLEVRGPGDALIASLALNEWETRFFGRRIGALAMAVEAAAGLPPGEWQKAVSLIAAAANAYTLVQLHLDVRGLGLAPALEDAGFRLVDTRVTFVTRVDRRRVTRYQPVEGEIRLGKPADLPDLLALAHQGLTHNPRFRSRFKDPAFFTAQDSERWFAAWVENDLADPMSLVAVWSVEDRIVGFFGHAPRGEREGLPVYRGTLVAIEPRWRGKGGHLAMQTYLCDQMPSEQFWVEDITQLANAPSFYNYIMSGRRLDRIELTFFRTHPT